MKALALIALLAAGPVGCGGGGGDGGPAEPSECVDVSGQWFVSERAEFNCDEDLDPFLPEDVSGSGTIQIQQDGCRVSYQVPDFNVEREGVAGLDFIELSGPIAIIQGVKVVRNELTITASLDPNNLSGFVATGTGRLTVESEGERGSCEVTSRATFRR